MLSGLSVIKKDLADYPKMGNFDEVLKLIIGDLTNFSKVAKFKITNLNLTHTCLQR